MRYYMLNIKHYKVPGNTNSGRVSYASFWLNDRKEAPIFFGDKTIADLINEKGPGTDFCLLGKDSSQWQQSLLVTIAEGRIWIYRPSGMIAERRDISNFGAGEVPKAFPIEMLVEKPARDAPLILASMKSNQHFSRATFREIHSGEDSQYIGNIAAIHSVLASSALTESFKMPIAPKHQIDCLSSVEFETLVAKLFEEFGLFVPAYKGGTMGDIDLIVENDSGIPVEIDDFMVAAGERKSLQVKLRSLRPEQDRGPADYVVAGNVVNGCPKNCLDRVWLEKCIAKSPSTKKWLERSTNWSRRR